MKNKVGRPIKNGGAKIQVSFRLEQETMEIIDEYQEATGATSRTEAIESLIHMMKYYTNRV